MSGYLFNVHGLPPGWKRDGVTRVMYENLNGLQSMLSKNEKLNKARQVINVFSCPVRPLDQQQEQLN
jgi:hypothetical protein